MNDFSFTKLLSGFAAAITFLAALAFGFLAFIGASLGKALNSNAVSASDSAMGFLVFSALVICSVITGLGSYRLANKNWRLAYVGFCFLLGLGFIGGFFISFGALGIKNELLILCIGLTYSWLGYLAMKKK
ncbi:hypothetical protein [Planococcus sp. YIM B11945]|uniref:hypothetical protein n=1 Tax=Planococcus sp. YIM B11945 TaxID=3435410 RepID=UPI003D7C6A0F